MQSKIAAYLRTFIAVISAAVGFIASLLAVMGLFTVKLPAYDFYLPCSFFYDSQTKAQQRDAFSVHRAEIQRLSEWASEVNGEVAYIRFDLAAGNELNVPCGTPDPLTDTHIGFWYGDETEISFDAVSSYDHSNAPSHTVVELPVAFNPTASPLHVVDETGSLFSLDGPFVVEYQFVGGSGGAATVSFTPVTDTHLWQEIGCAKNRLNYPTWMRSIVPCF